MHTGQIKGNYVKDHWTQCIITNPNFKCTKCDSKNISYCIWESSDGAYEDTHYKCEDCRHEWWVEGIDS
jgi:DNA-directed RNA polymerase subunit M/transcription elongation factor TFIIS